ncbi:hypothetical protein [Butyrivibrio sp. NC2002]|uniref:hypothetical protein n=1 Tax=Butyrivibrio sp. NC2002 TaxID=1410610 RepID=UPI0005623C76|nr:hypothetical protein [Butyrivibrio sp. NC2002]
MKVYEIFDEYISRTKEIGFLLYYEKADAFVIELRHGLTEWEAPLLFTYYVKKGIYTIPKEAAALWVKERVLPCGRQNLGMILRTHKLAEYNEAKILALGKGRSSQDECYIKEIKEDKLPDWVKQRQKTNIKECFLSGKDRIVCICEDGGVFAGKVSDLITFNSKIRSVIDNERLLSTLRADAGGYGIVFNDSITVDKTSLLSVLKKLDVTADDFYSFAGNNVLSTKEACLLFECTRQNLAYMIKTDALHPIKTGGNENLFLKGDVDRKRME